MNLFTCLLNQAVTLGIFNINPWLLGVFGVVALAIGVVLFVVRPTITYVDTEGDYVIHRERHPIFKKFKLHGASKNGKKLVGWSTVLGKSTAINAATMRLTRSITLYTIWEDVEYHSAVAVEFNYMDADDDSLAIKKEIFVLNAKLPDKQDDGAEIDGWSFDPAEAPVLTEEEMEAVFIINLYPIFEESPVSGANAKVNDQAIVDILYTDGTTEKNIYKESHYLSLGLPKEYEEYDNFLGWGFSKDGNIILDKTDAESIFTIQLYSKAVIGAENKVIEEAPAEEVIEEVVEEAAEEVIEEVAPEVVEEAPAEEVVEEVAEEVVEEAAEEAVEEAAEEVVEEVPAEEVVEEVVEEAPAEEVVEEAAPEVAPEVVEEAAEEVNEDTSAEVEAVIVPTYFDNEGNKIDIKYSRSITANIIQSEDAVKEYYSELKNHILSYKGVKSRISWKFDSYNRGRDQLFKIKLRGKTICLYCNLNPDDFDKSKYHHEAIDAKIFEDVPMLVKIKSGLGLRKAKELVDIEMAGLGIEKNPKAKEIDYVNEYPFEENEPLIERGLIKILVSDADVVKKSTKPVVEEVVPEVVEEVVEEAAPEVVEEVVEEAAPEVVEEVVEEAAPEIVEEVVEEAAPEIVEEVVEEEVYEEHVVIVEEVTAENADQIAEEQHIDIHVEEGVEYICAKDTKKAIVNVDTLSDAFAPHEVASLASMKAKGLIDKKAKTVKVLARGSLNKPIIVKAGDFSRTAIEMILLTGGNAVHVTYKIKK